MLPKPSYFQNEDELAFYQTHFDAVERQEPIGSELAGEALQLACRHGLSAADALNLAAALRMGIEEFVTTEPPGKPIFRVLGLKVIPLHAAV